MLTVEPLTAEASRTWRASRDDYANRPSIETGQRDVQPGLLPALEHQAGAGLRIGGRRHSQPDLRDAGPVDGSQAVRRELGGPAGAGRRRIAELCDALGAGLGIPAAGMQGVRRAEIPAPDIYLYGPAVGPHIARLRMGWKLEPGAADGRIVRQGRGFELQDGASIARVHGSRYGADLEYAIGADQHLAIVMPRHQTSGLPGVALEHLAVRLRGHDEGRGFYGLELARGAHRAKAQLRRLVERDRPGIGLAIGFRRFAAIERIPNPFAGLGGAQFDPDAADETAAVRGRNACLGIVVIVDLPAERPDCLPACAVLRIAQQRMRVIAADGEALAAFERFSVRVPRIRRIGAVLGVVHAGPRIRRRNGGVDGARIHAARLVATDRGLRIADIHAVHPGHRVGPVACRVACPAFERSGAGRIEPDRSRGSEAGRMPGRRGPV